MTVLPNALARRHFLHTHGLLEAPAGSGRGADLAALIDRLGFVQLDSVNTLARAHDLILWSRANTYRPRALGHLLARDRALFEHWTHDASILPIAHFPHWRHRFVRAHDRLVGRWNEGRRAGHMDEIDTVRRHITDHGQCSSSDLGGDEPKGSGGWWDWHPSKTALEFLWHTGEISVVRRDAFRKVYDLTERVIPPEYLNARFGLDETIDWACRAALARLGFATSGEIAAFWALITPQEAKDWCARHLASREIGEIAVQGHDGTSRTAFAFPGLRDTAAALPDPGARVRILSPFDPALRDRKRAMRLFGFHYRIEIFVPAAQRTYGYYVFPVLQGDRLIGRIDARADRATGCLHVTRFWPEDGVRMGAGRRARIVAELTRLRGLANCETVTFGPGWCPD